jgi:hypothetical protein
MDTPAAQQVYNTPFILFVFCALSAMVILVGILRWCWLSRDDNPNVGPLWLTIVWGQIYIFLGVTVFSLVAALAWFVYPYEDAANITIIPEIVILVGASYFFLQRYKRQEISPVKGFLAEIRNVLFWTFCCVLGWIVSFCVGYLIYLALAFMARNDFDVVIIAIMLTGLLWNLPTVWYFYFIRTNYNQKTTLMKHKVQTVILPMALAYCILMVPLAIHEAANSPALQKQKYEKPIRKV